MDEKLPQTSRQAFRFASLLLDARQQALHRTFPCHAALRFSHVLSIHLDLDLLCSFQGPRASPDAVFSPSRKLSGTQGLYKQVDRHPVCFQLWREDSGIAFAGG